MHHQLFASLTADDALPRKGIVKKSKKKEEEEELLPSGGLPLRNAARLKAGYYPLPQREAERMKNFLIFGGQETAVVDPCAGTGAALRLITDGEKIIRHGIELDAYRADKSRNNLHHVIHGNAFDVQSAVESFSVLYTNPPYDHEIGENRNARMEYLFLEHTYRWLKPGGVLVLVIPGDRLGACAEILAIHFRDKVLYRLSEPESVRYKQIVVFGSRRTRREREQLKDGDASRAKARLLGLSRNYEELPVLPDSADRQFTVPPSGPAQLVFRGIPLDTVENLLAGSPAYRQANRILFAPEIRATGRPLTPLHGGHVDTIRHVVDFPCKSRRTRLLSSWLHFIVEMFQAICCTDRARSDVSVVAGERQQHHFVFSGGPLLPVAACPANANLFFERSVAFAEIDFNARSGSQVSGSA